MAIGMVIGFEILNTAIEYVVDIVSFEYSVKAKKVKDVSAAATLFVSLISLTIGVLVFVPAVEMYIADVAGVKSKNHWFDQTKNLFISNLLTMGITYSLKYAINKTRPNGSPHSFPSGHTTFAFTNATVLYNEFYESSPVLAYSGYAVAITTGAFRMINNKHWFSDVLVGAGIGILVTNLVYYFEPMKNFNPFKKSKNIVVIPSIDYDSYGFYFSYRF